MARRCVAVFFSSFKERGKAVSLGESSIERWRKVAIDDEKVNILFREVVSFCIPAREFQESFYEGAIKPYTVDVGDERIECPVCAC